MLAKTIEDLKIYTLALQLAADTAKLIKTIPNNWKVSEFKQVLRSSSSIHSNIAEGFAQRFYPKQFIRYLTIALGSSDETQNHFRKLYIDNHVDKEIAQEFIKKYKNLSVKILNLINYLRKRYNIATDR